MKAVEILRSSPSIMTEDGMDLDKRVVAWKRQQQKLESLIRLETGRRVPNGPYVKNLQRWQRTLENKIAASRGQLAWEPRHEPPISGLC
jgi:hypothetical protein